MNEALRPSRLGNRGTTDAAEVRKLLDSELFCTVSVCHDGIPYSLPTGFCMVGDFLVIHGSVKSHFLQMVMASGRACITGFVCDGLVLAASAFHHSVNYRSFVIHTEPVEILDRDEKLNALIAFTEKMVPGRWDHLRPITEGEIKGTRVIGFSVEAASVKSRSGPPSFENEDAGFPVWTGVLPVKQTWGTPRDNPGMEPPIPVPEHVIKRIHHAH